MESNFFQSLQKESWEEMRLGDIGTIITGKTPSKNNPQDWGESMLFITPTDYKNYHKFATNSERKISNEGIKRFSKIILPKNSILVTCIGSDMGKVVMNKTEAITNQQINSIIPNPLKANNDFLYYSMVGIYPTLRLFGGDGTAVPILNKGDFENLTIALPPLKTQEKIAQILSGFDDKIVLLHKQNKTLETLAQTLFRHHFIENAKESWEVGKLGDLIIETIGGDWGKEKPTQEFNTQVCCIRGTDIADLNKGLATKTPIRFIKEKKLKSIEPSNGDIIMEISGGTETQSTGRCTYINQQIKDLFDYPIVFSNFCRLLRVKHEKYSLFLYLYLNYLLESDEFFALENGTSGIKNLDYKALLYDLPYKLPLEADIFKFHEKIKYYFEKINFNKQQIKNLEAMRDIILKKIFE